VLAAIGPAGGMLMAEMTAPAAPAANHVILFAEDNGSGKTRLMARFATGAAQQVAIEP
jgi:tRNA A37 threonylcarbamoyladenosine biosynthesis protein TsaE